MSKKVYLFSLVMLALTFVSCEETKEVSKYDNWQPRNESFIDSIANIYATAPNHGGIQRIDLKTAPGDYIYYKVKEVGADQNADSPKYLNYVKVHYKGKNILNEVFDGTFKGANPIVGDIEHEGTGEGDSTPAVLEVKIPLGSQDGGLITGWVEVLQRMKKGDRWEVYIPWQYAYGNQNKSTQIPAYSALIFDMILLDFSAKKEDLEK